MLRRPSRRTTRANLFLIVVLLLTGLGSARNASAQETTLRVIGFEVRPEEQGTPLDTAYQEFLAGFQQANPDVKIESLETPPEFETQLLVDLAAGTAPDVWQQDASSLAPLIDGGYILDMRRCVELVPELNLDRFFPNVLAIHQQPDGAIYGLPNDYTPMVVYYNPLAFQRANAPVPAAGWTWDDFLRTAQLLTLDAQGRNRLDPSFDETNVVQWGYRTRQFTSEWIYRVWQNGGDILSPDGTTASGFLDSPQTIEAIRFHRDLMLQHKVAPPLSALDQMTQSLGFVDRFLRGEFAMYDRGHWELTGLRASPEFKPEAIAVVGQPRKQNNATVIYESSWAVRGDLEGDKLTAACRFVNAATDRQYQDTKAITGIAIAANTASAEAAATTSSFPQTTPVFLAETANGRPPFGAKYPKGLVVEERLDSMMERILSGNDVNDEVARAVTEINRELGSS